MEDTTFYIPCPPELGCKIPKRHWPNCRGAQNVQTEGAYVGNQGRGRAGRWQRATARARPQGTS